MFVARAGCSAAWHSSTSTSAGWMRCMLGEIDADRIRDFAACWPRRTSKLPPSTSGRSARQAAASRGSARSSAFLRRPRYVNANCFAQPSTAAGRELMIATGFRPIASSNPISGATSGRGSGCPRGMQRSNFKQGSISRCTVLDRRQAACARDHRSPRTRSQRSHDGHGDPLRGLSRRAGLPDRGGVRRQRSLRRALPRLYRQRACRLPSRALLRRIRQDRAAGGAASIPPHAGLVQAGAGQPSTTSSARVSGRSTAWRRIGW